jgi:carbon storage regulator
MLVLSRKEGEAITIDGRIIVKVSKVSGDRVRLCIEAPRDVKVNRNEVERKIMEERTDAT